MQEYNSKRAHSKGLKKLLSISIVTYNPDLEELRTTLNSLIISLHKFKDAIFSVTIIDNSPRNSLSVILEDEYPNLNVNLIHGQGNIGFGRAHNLAMVDMGEFHLILNPDIELDPDALVNAVNFMNDNPKCGLATPRAYWPNGERQYLCKRFPSVFDLLLRGFAPTKLRLKFGARLAEYEMQAETQDHVCWNPPIASGCFMFFRRTSLQKTEGFDDRYFLYFEDFDLSIRTRSISCIAYVPTIRILHSGGKTSQKGFWHIKTFVLSSIKFFHQYGIKLF